MTRAAGKAAPAAEETTAAPISADQMRHLHALLRDHGISGDTAVHDYINAALTEHGDPAVESRRDLTTTQAARIIRDLETAEVAQTTHARATTAKLRALRAPFGDDAIGQLPRSTCRDCSQSQRKRCDAHSWVSGCSVCRGSHTSATIHITYVGHADVTARLLEVDPEWTWRPFTVEEVNALPPSLRGNGLWIMLTVLGVTRPGFGDAKGNTGGEDPKVMIGDALRNAAMRFGVALDLWAKGDREWAHAEKQGTDQHPDEPPPREQPAPPPERPPWTGPTTEEILAQVDSLAQRLGVTYEVATTKWREKYGEQAGLGRALTLDELDTLDPWVVVELEQWLDRYLQQQQTQGQTQQPDPSGVPA